MILDLTLSQQEIPLESIQLLGIMCLFLAQKVNSSIFSLFFLIKKLEEHTSLNYEKLQALCDNQYSLSQISFMELFICKTLKWRLIYPLSLDFSGLYCSLLLEESLHEEVLRELEDHLYLCFTESRFLLYSQSVISLSCLMHYFLNMNFNEGIEAIHELLGIYREVINYEKVVECCGILTNLLENGENTEGFLTPKRGIIEEIIEPSTATSVNYEETTENFEGRTLAKFF